MQLTFEYEKELLQGTSPAAAVMEDETLRLVYCKDSKMYGSKITMNTSDANSYTIDSSNVIAVDVSPNSIENTHISRQNWMCWRSGTKQRIALLPEAPKLMRPLFYKGFIAGYSLRRTNLRKVSTTVGPSTDGLTMEEKVDYNNGFILGIIATSQ